jgi:diaminopimelate epimerase
MASRARRFWKMTGSGNDFVFFDARRETAVTLETATAIGAICDRRRGVGADGVVFLENDNGRAFGIRYFNRDGSLAELCGNASLCSVTLARRLGIVSGVDDFEFGTSSGPLRGRYQANQPEIDTARVADLLEEFDTTHAKGESRIGFARVGVPHLVVLCEELEGLDVMSRGGQLRRLPSLPHGANANFVARAKDTGWAMRTYERGVEEETLACGTGAVAVAALLRRWGLAESPISILTRSGQRLAVRFRDQNGAATPSLQGEGRLVYQGTLEDIPELDF